MPLCWFFSPRKPLNLDRPRLSNPWEKHSKETITRWWFQIIFYVHPYLGKWSNLTNMFQVGWNHQLESTVCTFSFLEGIWLGFVWFVIIHHFIYNHLACCIFSRRCFPFDLNWLGQSVGMVAFVCISRWWMSQRQLEQWQKGPLVGWMVYRRWNIKPKLYMRIFLNTTMKYKDPVIFPQKAWYSIMESKAECFLTVAHTPRLLTPPMETPDPPNDTSGALKQVVLTPQDIPWSLRACRFAWPSRYNKPCSDINSGFTGGPVCECFFHFEEGKSKHPPEKKSSSWTIKMIEKSIRKRVSLVKSTIFYMVFGQLLGITRL